MQERLKAVAAAAREEISAAEDAARVEELRIKYLGKKGEVSRALGEMGKLAPEQRRALGEVANAVKAELEELMTAAVKRAGEKALERELSGPPIDVTLPGRGARVGRRHPVSRTMEEMVRLFSRLGFEAVTGPEVEYDLYNFECLNVPKDHPSRDMQDTFYLKEPVSPAAAWPSPVLLRTHTTPVDVRVMRSRPWPVRTVVGGRVFRRDSDITHTPVFHQVDGLYVDRRVTFADLKSTLDGFLKAFFGASVRTRFRPSFFPFTEPSSEVDVSCVMCGGTGCRVCKTSGWLEVLGCGMVHPNVLRAGGYDPGEVTGFAFGIGVERFAMLKYQIDDLRTMYENDARFLEQF